MAKNVIEMSCDTTVCNKKHSRGSPSPSMRLERKDNKKTVAEKKPVTKINSELKLRSKKSEVSDYSTPTSIHFTRSLSENWNAKK